jgi:hypothetical protein
VFPRDLAGQPTLPAKAAARTARIMAGLLSPVRYAQVIYLTAPRARTVVAHAAGALPPGEQSRVAVRELPAAAFAAAEETPR